MSDLSRVRTPAALMIVLALGGCMNVEHTFDELDAPRVWNAMVAAAEAPHYRDWHVQENHVRVDETVHRLEIHRIIHRQFYETAMKSRYEKREWRFEVTLEPTDPLKAEFVSRGAGVPAHARVEADRYFEQVRRLLSGEPMQDTEPRAGNATSAPIEPIEE